MQEGVLWPPGKMAIQNGAIAKVSLVSLLGVRATAECPLLKWFDLLQVEV